MLGSPNPVACALACNLTLVVPTARANPAAAADPFQGDPASTEVPSPEGPEWAAPPPPPPAPPPPSRPTVFAEPTSSYREEPAPRRPPEAPTEPESEAPGKGLRTAGIIFMGAAVGSSVLTYYTYDTRRKAESTLNTVEQSNLALIAAGLPPQDTSDLEQKIKLNRALSISFGIGAAVLLLTGGALFLAGYGRKQRSKPITWTPRITGIEVSF